MMSDNGRAHGPVGEILQFLVCPIDREPLASSNGSVSCRKAHNFPVIQTVPVLLHPYLNATLPDVFQATSDAVAQPLEPAEADRFVRQWMVRTNGNLYRKIRTPLERYPLPDFPLDPRSPNTRLLDVGGNWGRWALAAAGRGFEAIVIDPNLEAALVGTRVAVSLGLNVRYVVGDARALPFVDGLFGTAFSYSVLQHFEKETARNAMREMARVTTQGGRVLIQMPNLFGLRQATNRARQLAERNEKPFRVRYWTPRELVAAGEVIGPSRIVVDGFFSLNPRPEDRDLLPPFPSWLVGLSEHLKALSSAKAFGWVRWFADSLWLSSVRR